MNIMAYEGHNRPPTEPHVFYLQSILADDTVHLSLHLILHTWSTQGGTPGSCVWTLVLFPTKEKSSNKYSPSPRPPPVSMNSFPTDHKLWVKTDSILSWTRLISTSNPKECTPLFSLWRVEKTTCFFKAKRMLVVVLEKAILNIWLVYATTK